MIDTGRIDTSKPIDLATIANTKVFPIEPNFHHFGVNLTDEVTYLNGGISRFRRISVILFINGMNLSLKLT